MNNKLIDEFDAYQQAQRKLFIEGLSEETSPWHSPSEVPTREDVLYLVRNKEKQPLFFQPINGHWPSFVTSWMEIPE